MSVCLYPAGSYPKGVNYNVSISFNVPNAGTPLTIEKVHLVGKKLLVLARVNEQSSALMMIGLAEHKVNVKLPKGTKKKDIEVNRYVLGKTSGFSDETHKGINFIDDEVEYSQLVGEYKKPRK